jgi:ribonuclease P protein component
MAARSSPVAAPAAASACRPKPEPLASAPDLVRLKRRAEFLNAAKGKASARGAVLIQQTPAPPDTSSIRVGFTATKKLGGAVVRNRCKRRLREAARLILPELGESGQDYVFIARSGCADRPWERLLDDVRAALRALTAGGDPPRAPRSLKPPRKGGLS